MKKWACDICGYIIETETPKNCPVCNSKSKKFKLIKEENNLLNDNNIGLVKQCDINMIDELNDILEHECLEVALYIAVSKMAYKEGYDEVGDVCKKIAYEEANHASILIELLGHKIKLSTKENLKDIIAGEYEATQSKLKLVKKAKECGMDIVYNKLNQMYIDESNHGKIFSSLLSKYFEEK